MTQSIEIRQATQKDIPGLWECIRTLGYEKDTGYFERCLERQEAKELLLFIGMLGDDDVGYVILNWRPKYGLYQTRGIPEIQDLNILPAYRRRGLATQMIGHCEQLARKKGHRQIGIGVSVHRNYGPAQILYTGLGYRPDGEGVAYDRKAVEFGSLKAVDEQLCLMMIKDL